MIHQHGRGRRRERHWADLPSHLWLWGEQPFPLVCPDAHCCTVEIDFKRLVRCEFGDSALEQSSARSGVLDTNTVLAENNESDNVSPFSLDELGCSMHSGCMACCSVETDGAGQIRRRVESRNEGGGRRARASRSMTVASENERCRRIEENRRR